MKLSWIEDVSTYQGGAELASLELQRSAPVGVSIINGVSPNADAFVIHNCTQYSAGLVNLFGDKPVIKYVHDGWQQGDPALRQWLFDHAALLVMSSPLHRGMFPVTIKAPVNLIPNPLHLGRFVEAGKHDQKRKPACWVGRFDGFKGIQAAADYAKAFEWTLDYYGYGDGLEAVKALGNYCGQINHADMPQVMACYENFVFLPQEPEPFSRVAVEAWAAGCELHINNNVGAIWWIENNPAALFRGADLFWDAVMEAINANL